MKNQVIILFSALVILLSRTSGLSQERAQWVALDGLSKPGTPIQAVVQKTSSEGTTFEITVPGIWMESVNYGGTVFTRFLLPAVQLTGSGFPQRPGERGWYDFPAETGIAPLPPEKFANAIEIGTLKPVFPAGALGQKPRTEAEMTKLGIDPSGARPGIPTLRALLAVSRGNLKGDISVEYQTTESKSLQLPSPLVPAGFEGSDQVKPPDEGYTAPALIDEEFYGKFRGAYRGTEEPLSPLSGAGSFATIEAHIPLVEVTTPQIVKILNHMVVLVKHLKGTEDFTCPIGWDAWINLFPFINGAAIRDSLTVKGLKIEGSRSAHYLIVTPRVYREELNDFALWKKAKGLNVDFAYVGNAVGDDVPADRNALDAYLEAYFKKNYCHGVYVLLVGDVDVIPSGRTSRVIEPPDAADADSDHVYEVLGDERFPSLYVGRLSINSSEELTNQLGKILTYERNPTVGSWPTRATLAANSQNDDGSMFVSPSFPSKYAAAVNAIAAYGGYSSPPTFQVLHAGAASAAVTRAVNQDVVDALNAGRGIVLYRGHGGGSSWLSGWDANGNEFSSSIVSGLNNPVNPIVFSIACQNARLRNTESIAETWMSRVGGGAVAHWGASVNSFTDENHERAKGIFRALYESDYTRLGPATAEAERISHAVTGGGAGWDNNTFCYNLLGDPEMTVRKQAVPRLITLTGIVTNLNGRVLVQVRDSGGAAVPGGFVNLTLADGATINGFLNPQGELPLDGVTPLQVASLDLQADGYPATRVELPRFKREWLPFDPDAKAGAAILIGLLRSAQDETTLKIHVPGVWVKTSLYGGREVSEIEIPELDKLTGPGFPQQAGERGWYDFPAETGIEPMSPERYEHPFGAGVYKPVFPQTALGKAPNTEREMIAAGIDPAGARPGIPTLRGFLAVSRLNGPNDLSMIPGDAVFHDLQLPAPLKPAGFTGSDQATAAFGYTAPELFDADFYAKFQGAYRGGETPITPSGSVGAFTAAEVKLPLVEVTTPTLARVYGDLVVQFKHLKGTEDFVCPFSWDSWMHAMPFINGPAVREALTVKGLKIEGSRSAHYLILTPRLYRSNLDEFALWKQAKGLNVDFAYVGNAKTDDVTPDRNVIDGYIENYFKQNYCHGVYVLLVGDVDVIPSGRTARVDSAPDFSDADSDHIYEVIGDDRFPSLYVGRLSVNSADELKVQLGKILKYERNPIVGDWPTHVTLAANSQNDDGSMFVSPSFPSKYAAAVNAIASYAGYTDPPVFQVLHAGAASAAVTRAVNQDVVDAVNDGRGIVLYRGHGGGSSWLSGWDANGNEFGSSIVSGLSNSITPIIFSIACQNARLRNDDSIAETWLNQPRGGSVAHFGASVNSYTDENHERAKGLFRALYQSGFTRLGPVTAEGERISYTVTGGGAGWDNNTFCYNLLGDPEMTVRKRAVLPLSALAGILGHLNGRAFVQVNDAAGKPVGGSFVNVTLENGTMINGFANGEGQMLLPAVMPAAVASLDLQADGFSAARVTVPKSERKWVALDPDAREGTGILIGLLRADQQNTSLKIHVPGYWIKTSFYGGREVSEIEIPDLDKLVGPGIPQKAGERGWYDFPEETGIAPMAPDRFEHPFEQGVFHPTFPLKAVGQNPTTVREMEALGIDPAGARPGIPTLRGMLAVSHQSRLQDLSISFEGSTQKSIELPAPLRPAGYTGSDQAAEVFGYAASELFDEDFYANFKGSYKGPEDPIAPAGSAGIYGVAEVKIPMVEVSSAILANIYSDLVVNIKHLKGTEDFTCPISWDNWIFTYPFINGQAIRDALTIKGLQIEGSRSAHYLILTPREYRGDLDEFAHWKQSKGLNVDFAYVGVATTDDVAADRNSIDAYLENYFKANYCHGVYVLIVGDVDVVPSGRSTRVDMDPDGNDADSDHIYEVLGSDRFPSLYVGRLSINSATELKNQLAKILSYERSPTPGSWPTKATLAANSQNDDGSMFVSSSFPSKYAAAVNAIASFGGYLSPPTFQVLHAGAASAAVTRAVNQDVVNAINDGRGIVLYRGHGGGSGWVYGWDANGNDFSSSIVMGLSNPIYPIVFSIACQNARLRNNDSIAEVWMNQANGGAVAHFGASVNSYTSENHERAKGLFRAIYQSGFTRLAPAIAEGERISFGATGGGGGWDNNTFCYNLLGDPELTIRKKSIPRLISINPELISANLGTVLRFKDSDGNAVQGALVRVLLTNQRDTNLFTGPDGSFVLGNLKPAEIAEVQVHADGYPFTDVAFSGPARASLSAVGFGRVGDFGVRADSTDGDWTIQGSTDLQTWLDLGTISGGVTQFNDTEAARFPYRFYRTLKK